MCALQHKSLQPQPISKNQERWQKQHTAAKAELGMCNGCACSPTRFDSHPATSTALPRSPRKLQTKNLQRTSSSAHVRKTLSAAASFSGRNKNARQGKAKSSVRPSVPVRSFVRFVRSFVRRVVRYFARRRFGRHGMEKAARVVLVPHYRTSTDMPNDHVN